MKPNLLITAHCRYLIFALIPSLFFAGCEKSQPVPPPKTEVAAPILKEEPVQKQEDVIATEKAQPLPAGTSVSIAGIVRYEGAVPTFSGIKMDADPVCSSKHGEAVMPQTLVLGEGQTMANVFVFVSVGAPKGGHPVPSTPAVVDQKGCMYEPHVLGVMAGQAVKFLNPDGTLHNVHAMPKINAEFNLAMPKFRTEVEQVFQKSEFMFPVKCDVHPWMGAWISVMDHPFFAVTKGDGAFAIDGLAPGEYEVSAWHEKLGTQKRTVKVPSAEAQTIDFIFSKP